MNSKSEVRTDYLKNDSISNVNDFNKINAKKSNLLHEFTIYKDFISLNINNFTKGIKISPDNLCFLTNSNDNSIRLFEYPSNTNDPNEATIEINGGGIIYDFSWYPYMNSNDPTTCCFLTTSQGHPIHLWDAYTGDLRATYRGYDHLDEINNSFSLAFNPSGDKIFAGYNRMIRVFSIANPGRDCEKRPLSETKKSRNGQKGIISSIHFNPDQTKMYAAGSYNGTTYIYSEDTGEEYLMLGGHYGGITQVQFSTNGLYLFTGARKDNNINCWDIRNTRTILHSFDRQAETNQKIGFDIHMSDKYLITGSENAVAYIYSIDTGILVDKVDNLPDAVNGVSLSSNPMMLDFLLSTGKRHFNINDIDDIDASDPTSTSQTEKQSRNTSQILNTVQCWKKEI